MAKGQHFNNNVEVEYKKRKQNTAQSITVVVTIKFYKYCAIKKWTDGNKKKITHRELNAKSAIKFNVKNCG